MKTELTHSGKIEALAAGHVQDAAPGPKRKATGDWTFSGQPSADETITVNGVVFTFKASGAVGNQINIGAAATDTIDNAVTILNGSADAAVAKATYSNSGGTKLRATYDVYGSAGNAFTLAEAASNVTVSGAVAAGGADADPMSGAETYALKTPAAVNGSTDAEWDLADGDEGQEVTVYLHTKGASSNAKVNGTFNGGTVLTLDTAAKLAKLKWLKDKWFVIVNTGTIA